MDEISSRYGLALFSLACDSKKVESLQEEAKALSSLLEENPEFSKILSSGFLSYEERIDIIDKALKGFDVDLINLIKVLIDNSRASNLEDVLLSFNSYCNEYRGVLEGLVYSISPLSKEVKTNIEKKISEIEHVKVELYNKIDPSLIGGIKVVIQDRVYDGSIQNKLEMMKKSLTKKEA